MSDHLTPLEDMRRERDEAQARADKAEQRLSELTRRMASDPAAYEQIKLLNARLAALKSVPQV